MARGAVGWIGVVLLGAVGPLAAAPGDEEPVRLRAVSIEIARLSPVSFELMTGELDSLFAKAGLRIVWRRAAPAGQTAPDELRVVFLDTPGRGAHADGSILAAADAFGPAPTVWVYVPRVVAALNLEAHTALQAFVVDRALGVALGRVLAHELIHVLVPAAPHGEGTMATRVRLVALDHTRPSLDAPLADALAGAARSWHARGGPSPERHRGAPARFAAARP